MALMKADKISFAYFVLGIFVHFQLSFAEQFSPPELTEEQLREALKDEIKKLCQIHLESSESYVCNQTTDKGEILGTFPLEVKKKECKETAATLLITNRRFGNYEQELAELRVQLASQQKTSATDKIYLNQQKVNQKYLDQNLANLQKLVTSTQNQFKKLLQIEKYYIEAHASMRNCKENPSPRLQTEKLKKELTKLRDYNVKLLHKYNTKYAENKYISDEMKKNITKLEKTIKELSDLQLADAEAIPKEANKTEIFEKATAAVCDEKKENCKISSGDSVYSVTQEEYEKLSKLINTKEGKSVATAIKKPKSMTKEELYKEMAKTNDYKKLFDKPPSEMESFCKNAKPGDYDGNSACQDFESYSSSFRRNQQIKPKKETTQAREALEKEYKEKHSFSFSEAREICENSGPDEGGFDCSSYLVYQQKIAELDDSEEENQSDEEKSMFENPWVIGGLAGGAGVLAGYFGRGFLEDDEDKEDESRDPASDESEDSTSNTNTSPNSTACWDLNGDDSCEEVLVQFAPGGFNLTANDKKVCESAQGSNGVNCVNLSITGGEILISQIIPNELKTKSSAVICDQNSANCRTETPNLDAVKFICDSNRTNCVDYAGGKVMLNKALCLEATDADNGSKTGSSCGYVISQ